MGAANEERTGVTTSARRDLLSALAGKQADRDSSVAERTRRVVNTSLGVMKDQKDGRARNRSLALAALMLVLLAVGPLLWHLTDELIGGEQIGDMPAQVALLVCVLGPALAAAALLAWWPRRKS